jgi:hypothetical protein
MVVVVVVEPGSSMDIVHASGTEQYRATRDEREHPQR